MRKKIVIFLVVFMIIFAIVGLVNSIIGNEGLDYILAAVGLICLVIENFIPKNKKPID